MKNFSVYLVLLSAILYGCTSTSSSSKSPEPILFGPKPNFEQEEAFQQIISHDLGSKKAESAKIDYLIDRNV